MMTEHRMARRVGLAVALLVAMGAVVAGRQPARAATGSGPQTQAVAADRQSYVSDTPVDPYNNDQLSLHVAAAGGSETARSFVRLALDALPGGATSTDALLKVVSNGDNTSNVNTAAAIVEACVLMDPIAAPFDPAKPPRFDCSKGSSVGKAADDGSWTFALRDLVAYWNANGNTGAAIIPVAAPGDTWSLAFDKTLTGGQVTWTTAATASTTAPTAAKAATPTVPARSASGTPITTAPVRAPAGSPVGATPATEVAPTPAPTSAPAPSEAAAPAAPAGSPSTGVRTVPGHRSTTWVWVLLVALVAAGVLAGPSIASVAAAGGRAGEVVRTQLQAHGRALVTSGLVVAWAVTYTVYSIAITPVPRVVRGTEVAAGEQATATGGAGATTTMAGGETSTSSVSAAGTNRTAATGVSTKVGGTPTTAAANGSTASANELAAQEANLPAAAKLFDGADDRIGITDNSITLCGHSALTFGPAFSINKSDLNVFWQNLNAHGGINGRTFKVDWQDDSYQPGPAVTAAQTCKDEGTFMLLGGIGFDQIPAVRVWAEQNHELYLHHVAVERGSEGLRYSFSALPSVEQMGRMFGQLAVQKYRGMKIGILWRNSSNWQPGRDEFRKVVQGAGVQIVGDYPVQNNQGNYTQQIVQLKAAGADVVFVWENALAATEILRQAKAQAYSPHFMLFPFNLTLQTVGQDAMNPPLDGIAAWPAYTAGKQDGPYASYASDLQEFEREYKQWDPNANLAGPGGDLLFLAWTGFKQLADMFQQCGRNCTRNEFAALMLNGYHRTVTPNCDADFSQGDHHHAAPRMDVFTTAAGPNNQPIWVPTQRCISEIKVS